MNPDRLIKLVAQWTDLIVKIGALIAAIGAIWTPLWTLNPWAWSWREIVFALIAGALAAVILIRSRNAHLSRLMDPEALRLDPQVPEQLVGRQDDLAKFLNALSNRLVFLVGEVRMRKDNLLAGRSGAQSFIR